MASPTPQPSIVAASVGPTPEESAVGARVPRVGRARGRERIGGRALLQNAPWMRLGWLTGPRLGVGEGVFGILGIWRT